MSVMIVYKPMSEHARIVDEYLRDFQRRTARAIDVVNPDTRDGVEICNLYDVVEYPTIIATNEDGKMRNMWRGLPLPTIDEVSYYVL
ncbi:MAG: hypothetical protein WAW80_02490 [Candidatus Saccharimonadales bacterium]